jgi:hypothetical protein
MWRRVSRMSETPLGRRVVMLAAAGAACVPLPRLALAQNTTWQAPAPVMPHPNDGFSALATDPSLEPVTHGRPPLRVGPGRTLQTLMQAARAAQAGDVIEVDAGEYRGEAALAVWHQAGLVLRAVGGRVRLLAQGAHSEGKGIWVTRSPRLAVHGFDFEGASVHDRNGAGIRHERGALFVRDCRFLHNETGLITGNESRTVLEVDDCEFGHNGYLDGHSHNLYVGRIARLAVRGSWLHHARRGHLLKSRAAFNEVRYNRLVDGPGGQASYELEFPEGGVAHVVGNVIGQAASTENRSIVAYGAEGYRGARHELLLVHNTIVDEGALWGRPLWVLPGAGTLLVANNLVVGGHGFSGVESAAQRSQLFGNFAAHHDEFEPTRPGEYRLHPQSRLLGRAASLSDWPGAVDVQPQREYVHPRHSTALVGRARHPGAMQ